MHPILLALLVLALLAVVLLGLRPLRRAVLSAPIFNMYRKVLPQMSDTERDALEAGTVWWEGELFRGRPDWSRLHAYPRPRLSDDEQRFGQPGRGSLPHGQRLGSHAGTLRPARRCLELPEEPGLPGHDHSQVLRRPGLFRLCAFRDRDQAVDPLVGAGRVGHGAELAGPGRAAAALRHRRAEEPLSAAPRAARKCRPSR